VFTHSATKQDIEDHFNSQGTGKITDIKIMNGFGFIEYEDALDARDIVPSKSFRIQHICYTTTNNEDSLPYATSTEFLFVTLTVVQMEATSKESVLPFNLPEGRVTRRPLMDQLIVPLHLVLVEPYIECKSPVFLPIPAGRLASHPLISLRPSSNFFLVVNPLNLPFEQPPSDCCMRSSPLLFDSPRAHI